MLTRTRSALHIIDETSPLLQKTPGDHQTEEIELLLSVAGIDETALQPVVARRQYRTTDILFGARHQDVLRERPTGKLELDVRRFHTVMPTEPTESFPCQGKPSESTKSS